MGKLRPEVREFIDHEITLGRLSSYHQLAQEVALKYAVKVSKATISKRARALKLRFQPGRKHSVSVAESPAHSLKLDCAGAFFLKGADLEMGLLSVINRVLDTRTASGQALRALKLAQQINALLLYAPVFGLKTARQLSEYRQKGLLYLSGQTSIPTEAEIRQYLQFLTDNKLLLVIIKEVKEICPEVLCVRIESGKQVFYLDGQGRTVWPTANIPVYFTSTINKAKGYVKEFLEYASPHNPLILQVCPGYNFLPPEMFSLIQCFGQAPKIPALRVVLTGPSGEILSVQEQVQPQQKCYFVAALSPWQFAGLRGTKIIKNFQSYRIGPRREPMEIADAQVSLLNPQLNENIIVRAVLIRRQAEKLALITNISPRPQEERYAYRLAEQYFSRWPQAKLNSYYDLLEEAHAEAFARSRKPIYPTSLLEMSYAQRPIEGFNLLLEELHRYAQSHFFPAEYEGESFDSLCEKFYRQAGCLKIRRAMQEVILFPFTRPNLQQDVQQACQRFQQSQIKFPDDTRLLISLR